MGVAHVALFTCQHALRGDAPSDYRSNPVREQNIPHPAPVHPGAAALRPAGATGPPRWPLRRTGPAVTTSMHRTG